MLQIQLYMNQLWLYYLMGQSAVILYVTGGRFCHSVIVLNLTDGGACQSVIVVYITGGRLFQSTLCYRGYVNQLWYHILHVGRLCQL